MMHKLGFFTVLVFQGIFHFLVFSQSCPSLLPFQFTIQAKSPPPTISSEVQSYHGTSKLPESQTHPFFIGGLIWTSFAFFFSWGWGGSFVWFFVVRVVLFWFFCFVGFLGFFNSSVPSVPCLPFLQEQKQKQWRKPLG